MLGVSPNRKGNAPPIRSRSHCLNRSSHLWESPKSHPLPPRGSVPPGSPATDSSRKMRYRSCSSRAEMSSVGPSFSVLPFSATFGLVRPRGCTGAGRSWRMHVPHCRCPGAVVLRHPVGGRCSGVVPGGLQPPRSRHTCWGGTWGLSNRCVLKCPQGGNSLQDSGTPTWGGGGGAESLAQAVFGASCRACGEAAISKARATPA